MANKEKKGIVKEFKEFISRGSIVDMAVGVVVGGAFTTIVNTLVKSVLTPLVNFVIYLICGGNTGAFKNLDVVLIKAVTEDVFNEAGEKIGENIITPATVLGFSDLITAVLNFFLIALTLFLILKAINKIRAEADELKNKMNKAKEEKSEEETTVNE